MSEGEGQHHEHQHPLTEREMEAIRAIIEQDKRARWLWSNIRVIATWITAVLLAGTLGVDAIKRFLSSLGH